jgi:hypothetical protein
MRPAAKLSASSQVTSRQGSVIASRIIGFRMRSLWLGIAPGEAALDAAVAPVRLAVLVGNHAHQLVTAHFRLERAADAAIGTGGDHGMLRLADLDHALFLQRRRRAGLHAGAAGYAFGGEERVAHHAGRNAAVEATALDGQREGALDFLAGAHAARADDAFRRVIGEIRVALVLGQPLRIDVAASVSGAEMGVHGLV